MPIPIDAAAAAAINAVYQAADHPPEVETSLRNAARATTILGKMLEAMADKYAKKANPVAGYITKLGLLAYGLIEISVPRTLWFHIARYWLKLVTLLGAAMVVLGVFFKSQETWKMGAALLLVAAIIVLVRYALQRLMRLTASLVWWLKALLIVLVVSILFAGAAVLVLLYGEGIGQCLVKAGNCLKLWPGTLHNWLVAAGRILIFWRKTN
jgi:hypothetical protein